MSKKVWQIMPSLSDDLKNKNKEYSPILLQLLKNRNIETEAEIREYLYGEFGVDTHSPFLFNQMEEVVALIIKHIKAHNKIVVYGDYDADGVTASAVLVEILEIFKAEVGVYIPDRVNEGYGLNKEAIDGILEEGVKLIITVDGGIRNHEEVKYAKSKGLDIIITDHHVAPENKEEMPDCLIINTQVEEEKYPFKYLAGVGAAFKLARALISKAKLEDAHKKRLEERLLDLVSIGTVADMVSLVGENRILTKKGLEILNSTTRPGLKELIKGSNINHGRILTSWNIGFQLAPRLNAAGRINHANTAYELLMTKDQKEARKLAQGLNENNLERQDITIDIVDKVKAQINEDDKIIIGLCGESDEKWNEGVIGLVAGKIANKYYRPTLVITKTEDGYKGSGRGILEFNIVEAVEEASDYLDKYGGHPMACGFSLQEKDLDNFLKKIREIADKKLADVNLAPKIQIDTELKMEEINEELISNLELMEPFGKDNERPIFCSRNVQIMDIAIMGFEQQHIKFRLKEGDSRVVSALGFGQARKWQDCKVGDLIDIAYYLEINEFNGRREIQMKIVDIILHDK
jgi:single-stranded-DNA-specific exonuclease